MKCTNPLDAWRPKPGAVNHKGEPSGRLVFNLKHAQLDAPLQLACGQCRACRFTYAQQWAVRCHHEAQMHEHNHFATFTYSPEHLPADYSVHVHVMQSLHYRMRYRFGSFRFLGCGENGETLGRPHYHGVYFGLELPDLVPVSQTSSGEVLYRSEALEECWGFGAVRLGAVTLQSAAYVAAYAAKSQAEKVGKVWPHPETGEMVQVTPPFLRMSRMPGLGVPFFERFRSDFAKGDFCIINGRKYPVPAAYFRHLEEWERDAILLRRRNAAVEARAREAEAHEAAGFGQSRDLTRWQLREIRHALKRSFDEAVS